MTKKFSFSHKIGKTNRRIVIVSTSGKIGSIKAITFSNTKLPMISHKEYKFDWKFPFVHRVETVISFKELK